MDQPRGAPAGSRLPELTKRTILMLKEQHPEWGCQRISDLLLRGPTLPASASAVARVRIGHFIDYDNFQRPHRGAGGLVPADRFFQAAPTVLRTLKERVAANALELARYGQPKSPFYVTGQVAGQAFSVHAEGERLVRRREGQEREEIELTSSGNGSAGNASPDRSSPATAGAVGGYLVDA